MATTEITYDEVVEKALKLSPPDQARLIERLASVLKYDVPLVKPFPLDSGRGLLAHLGPAPSAEDIDEARREAWANFPREDIA